MASKTEICNLALSHLGHGKEIANLDTERSEEARACRRFYDVALQATLVDHAWSFATEFATLGLVEESPTDEWAYSYRYPSNCLMIIRIPSGQRQDTLASKVPYKIVKDSVGKLIYTDKAEAEIEYIYNVEDPTFYTAQFIIAFSFRLASYIAPRLTGGDPFKLKEEMLGQYILELGRAKGNNLNEEQQDVKRDSPSIQARS